MNNVVEAERGEILRAVESLVQHGAETVYITCAEGGTDGLTPADVLSGVGGSLAAVSFLYDWPKFGAVKVAATLTA